MSADPPPLLKLSLKRALDAETPHLLFEASETRCFVPNDAIVISLRARMCSVGDRTRIGCFLIDLRPVARYAGLADVEIIRKVAELVKEAVADGEQLAVCCVRHTDAQRAKAAIIGDAGEKKRGRDAHGFKFVPLATAVALLAWLVRRIAVASRPELLPGHEQALVALTERVLSAVDHLDAAEVARARQQLLKFVTAQ